MRTHNNAFVGPLWTSSSTRGCRDDRTRRPAVDNNSSLNVAIALNAVTGSALLLLLGRLRGQLRWWSKRGLLQSLPLLNSFAPQNSSNIIEFGPNSEWINSESLSLRSGKLVLLHFWTFGCFNCVHALDTLRRVEDAVSDERLMIVSVHAGKFPSERLRESVAKAVQRLGIEHPVVNDKDLELWRQVGAVGWPTLALISPQGSVIGVWAGEPDPTLLEKKLRESMEYWSPTLDSAARTLEVLRHEKEDKQQLIKYPHGVVLDWSKGYFFVTDSGHHRVLKVHLSGEVIATYGGDQPGFVDGTDEDARFRRPQGLFLDEVKGSVLVADTGNHAIRCISIENGQVTTLVGSGQQGLDFKGGRSGADQPLCSPTDVCIVPELNCMIVAMAGSNQLWKSSSLDLEEASFSSFSGSGMERKVDARNAASADWAQPSGLSLYKAKGAPLSLVVADTESSSIRSISLETKGFPTRTIAGGDALFGDNLFAFGDRVGFGMFALFSHPLAVVAANQSPVVFVADSNNHRIKKLNLESRRVENLCGSGEIGFVDGVGASAKFWEPIGLALSPDDQTLLVVDRNNNSIRMVDVASAQVSTLHLIL